MAKYSGGKTSVGRKIEGEMDWTQVEGTGVDPNAGLDDTLATPLEDAGAVDERLSADVEALTNLDVFADVRQQLVSDVRQEIAEDPAQYEEFQAYGQENIGQPGQQVGVGVGYESATDTTNVSPINAINALQSKVAADPNDFMAREQLLGLLGDQHTDAKGRTEERLAAEPGMERPGTYSFGKMSVEERLRRAGDSAAMGNRVKSVLNDMTFNMNEQEIAALSAKVKATKEDGTQLEPGSLNEVINGVLSTYANVKEAGGHAPQAFADIALHAVAHNAIESEKRKAKNEDQKLFGGFNAEEALEVEQKHAGGSDAGVGRLIAKSLGGKGSNTTDTAVGALAKDIVGRAFPEIFVKGPNGFEVRQDAEMDKLRDLGFMTSVILPETKKVVRDTKLIKKVDEKAGFEARVINALGNIAYTNDQEFYAVAEQLVAVTDANGQGNYVDKLNKIYVDPALGTAGTINNRPDIRVVNGKEEFYLGNSMKDMKFNETLDWARSRGNKAHYYDYVTGRNNRFYAEQTEGDYQGDTLARAGLQAAKAEVYDLRNVQDVTNMKAGIVKKFGEDKLGVNAAANFFDTNIDTWVEMFNDIEGEGGRRIIDAAHAEERWASVSAMKEAVKFKKALDSIDRFPTGMKPQYRSKFFTEVDGVANGLGHNALQSGDWKVARRTNLNPDVDFVKAGESRTSDTGEVMNADVYLLAGTGAEAAIQKGSNAVGKKAWNLLFGDKGGMARLRNFAKKPLMIFGYGAGWNKINDTVDGGITDILNENPDIAAVFNAEFNDPGSKRAVADAFHDAFKTGIETNFEGIHELSQLLSTLASEAVAQGIDPKAITVDGRTLLFGLDWSELESEKAFFDRGIDVRPKKKVLLPGGRVIKKEGQYDRLARSGEMVEKTNRLTGAKFLVPAGTLKSATQAAVLLTHNNDAANIGESFLEMAKNPDTNIAAQIFDGVLTTPKQADKTSKQLNKDFVKIAKANSNLVRLMDAMNEQHFNWGASNATRKLRQRIMTLENKRKKLLAKITAEKTKQFYWD